MEMCEVRVFVVYGSGQVAARVILELQRVPSVRFVGQSQDDTVTIAAIRSSQPDAVLFVGPHLEALTLRQIFAGLREINPTPRILLMTDYSFVQYKKEGMRMGADHVFETTNEFQGMIDLFREDRITNDPDPERGLA